MRQIEEDTLSLEKSYEGAKDQVSLGRRHLLRDRTNLSFVYMLYT